MIARTTAVALALLLAGCGPQRPPETPAERFAREGAELYATRCTACHQRDARGLPGMFPPLAGSPWLTDSNGAERATAILLYGVAGRIQVMGQFYDQEMPNFKLTDRQIAAVLTHVRSHFGNDAPPIDELFVTKVRAKHGARGPWTPYELLALYPL